MCIGIYMKYKFHPTIAVLTSKIYILYANLFESIINMNLLWNFVKRPFNFRIITDTYNEKKFEKTFMIREDNNIEIHILL